jgi:rubredoxin
MATKKISRYESPCAKYVYDPEAGDYERNIPRARPLKNCPMIGAAPNAAPRKNFLKSWTTKAHLRKG